MGKGSGRQLKRFKVALMQKFLRNILPVIFSPSYNRRKKAMLSCVMHSYLMYAQSTYTNQYSFLAIGSLFSHMWHRENPHILEFSKFSTALIISS
jgi:hypothetical protein